MAVSPRVAPVSATTDTTTSGIMISSDPTRTSFTPNLHVPEHLLPPVLISSVRLMRPPGCRLRPKVQSWARPGAERSQRLGPGTSVPGGSQLGASARTTRLRDTRWRSGTGRYKLRRCERTDMHEAGAGPKPERGQFHPGSRALTEEKPLGPPAVSILRRNRRAPGAKCMTSTV